MEAERFFFSIVIPTRNRPAQLKACLESISRLDYPADRFEVIVVDDGSQTSLERVVSPFREQIDLTLFSQRNSGPGIARNHGAGKARGRLLAFTDDDCMPAADWLKALAARFAGTPDRAIGGRTLNALPGNPYSSTSQAIMDFVYAHYNANPDHPRFFASNNLAMPADLFNSIDGFDRGWPLAASEDRELCDRWLQYGYRMTYAPEAVVYHAHSLTLSGFWRQHFNYGRGAYRFHQVRAQRGQGPFKPEVRFYMGLLHYSFLQKYTRLLPILAMWQLANTAGFLCEMIRSRNRRDRRRVNDMTPLDHK
jgi:glycosyltransferase involved in cell wall biosynthesis